MSPTAKFVEELNREAVTTRRVLDRVPAEKFGWKPHAKSMSLGQLALHVAQTPSLVARVLEKSATEPNKFQQAEASSKAEIDGALDLSVAEATDALNGWGEAGLDEEWSLSNQGRTLLAVPRETMVRSIMFNHWYHHRGQLLVYLRMLDVPLPSVYGPTADENPFV